LKEGVSEAASGEEKEGVFTQSQHSIPGRLYLVPQTRHVHHQMRLNISAKNGLVGCGYTPPYRCSTTTTTNKSAPSFIKGERKKKSYPTSIIITPTNRPPPIHIQTPNTPPMTPQTPQPPPPLYIPNPYRPIPRPRHRIRPSMQHPHTPNRRGVSWECIYKVPVDRK
jgi:hypothetical protein